MLPLPLSSVEEEETMQRCCYSRLRHLAIASMETRTLSSSSHRFLCASSPPQLRELGSFPANRSVFKALLDPSPRAQNQPGGLGFRPTLIYPFQMMQRRDFASKDRSRAPATPVTSKLKKYKIKAYSSFKSRFRTMNDGTIRRWRAGKRHNAHLKSKKSKRRLRRPEIVHPAYAKVMKKLNFCG